MKQIIVLFASLLLTIKAGAKDWTLITDPSILREGDKIVLAYAADGVTAGLTFSAGLSSSYLESVEAIFDGSSLTEITENTALFTLSGSASAWTLTNQYGQKLGATAAKKLAWDLGNTTWTIQSDRIVSTVSAYGFIQYNEQSARFANMSSEQAPIQIFRQRRTVVGGYTLSYEGFPYKRTFCEIPSYEAGERVVLPAYIPQKAGTEFFGWSYNGRYYFPLQEFVMPAADVVMVPVWGDDPRGVENIPVETKATKIIRDGQLIIVRDGVEYNVLGTEIQY